MLKSSYMRSPVLVVSNFSGHSNAIRNMSNNAFNFVADCSCKAHKDKPDMAMSSSRKAPKDN